jgi:hypothetical protein
MRKDGSAGIIFGSLAYGRDELIPSLMQRPTVELSGAAMIDPNGR